MTDTQLAAIDLNLFVAFDALMTERSVTRAAKRIGITQSAMSHALNRLRAVLDDPLLVRSPDGMLPTPRAMELMVPIQRAIADLTRTLSGQTVRTRRTFKVAVDDVGELIVAAPLYTRLRGMPEVSLCFESLQPTRIERQLAHGEVDVAVCVSRTVKSQALLQQRLLQDRYVAVSKHATQISTMAQYLGADHVTYPGDPVTAPRRVVAASQLSTALLLAMSSNLVLVLPECVARQAPDLHVTRVQGLEVRDLVLSQLWHERQARDQEHVELRALVVEVCTSFMTGGRSTT